MYAARKIERFSFVCPEVNCRDYDLFPLLDEGDYMGMCNEFCLHSSEICIFIFVRESGTHVPFVDIYVWNTANLDGYDHFIICDGFRLPKELEFKFLEYMDYAYIYISDCAFHEANKKIMSAFPQWHYKDYSVSDMSLALQHMYFASHRSGPREILFKAEGIEYIAANLDKLPGFNIIGTTPSDIIDREMPLKLLRILSQEDSFQLLCSQSDRELCKAAYERYCGFIGKMLPSAGQWNYILELYKNGGVFGGYGFRRDIYDMASCFIYQDDIEMYDRFFSVRKKLGIHGKITARYSEDVWNEIERMENLLRYRKGSHIDSLFAERKSESSQYEYSNKDYEIIMPSCAFDMCKEAVCQHNCLADFIYDHAEGETTILFLRKRTAPDVSFVTMEVGPDLEIKQVYGKCNSLPRKDVYEFIVEYSKAKSFTCDLSELIINNIHRMGNEDRVHMNELVEFAEQAQYSANQSFVKGDDLLRRMRYDFNDDFNGDVF